jgi:hypothetical protein
MDNLNTATKGALHALREPAGVQNEVYRAAAIEDLYTASKLTAEVAVRGNEVGLTEKQLARLEKATHLIGTVHSQLKR